MKTRKASGALGLLAVVVFNSPMAAADRGVYIGGSLGLSKGYFNEGEISARTHGPAVGTQSISSRDDEDLGRKVFGGYQFNRNFALEAGYFHLGHFGFTAITVPPGPLDGSMRVRGANFDAVGIIPFNERFSAFGRAGVTWTTVKGSFSGAGAVAVTNPNPEERDLNYKFGVGVQYNFNWNFGVRGEAERYRVNDAVGGRGDVDLFSVGLVYRFGARPVPVVHQRAPEPAPRPSPPPPPAPAARKAPPPPQEYVAPPPPPPAPVEKPIRKDRN